MAPVENSNKFELESEAFLPVPETPGLIEDPEQAYAMAIASHSLRSDAAYCRKVAQELLPSVVDNAEEIITEAVSPDKSVSGEEYQNVCDAKRNELIEKYPGLKVLRASSLRRFGHPDDFRVTELKIDAGCRIKSYKDISIEQDEEAEGVEKWAGILHTIPPLYPQTYRQRDKGRG